MGLLCCILPQCFLYFCCKFAVWLTLTTFNCKIERFYCKVLILREVTAVLKLKIHFPPCVSSLVGCGLMGYCLVTTTQRKGGRQAGDPSRWPTFYYKLESTRRTQHMGLDVLLTKLEMCSSKGGWSNADGCIWKFARCVASEPELPLPRVCPCQNSGLCVEDEKGELVCQCPPEFLGRHCDTYAVRRGSASGNMAVLVIPIVILLVLLSAGAIYVFIRKRPL